jgi:hypothetical protein
MFGPQHDSFPKGQGIRAQIIYCIDMLARLVVGVLGLILMFIVLFHVFGDVPVWPKH